MSGRLTSSRSACARRLGVTMMRPESCSSGDRTPSTYWLNPSRASCTDWLRTEWPMSTPSASASGAEHDCTEDDKCPQQP